MKKWWTFHDITFLSDSWQGWQKKWTPQIRIWKASAGGQKTVCSFQNSSHLENLVSFALCGVQHGVLVYHFQAIKAVKPSALYLFLMTTHHTLHHFSQRDLRKDSKGHTRHQNKMYIFTVISNRQGHWTIMRGPDMLLTTSQLCWGEVIWSWLHGFLWGGFLAVKFPSHIVQECIHRCLFYSMSQNIGKCNS